MKAQIFDRLWIDCWKSEIGGNKPDQAAEVIVRLAHLAPDLRLLDFGCGTGRVAHALTRFNIHVTGIDRSAEALYEATRHDNRLCRFIQCDWHDYVADQPFDCAIFWFTTLCSGADRDYASLRVAWNALRPGGVLLIETRHWDSVPRRFHARSERSANGCTLIEHHSFDQATRTQTTHERYECGTSNVMRTYHTRRYGFAELRALCVHAGFGDVEGFDETGLSLSDASERLILRARRSGSTG